MRMCLIHVGTHRTATTSLQVALSRSRRTLSGKGYLYPVAGVPTQAPDGHHNIAWEIAGDRRFRQENGTVEDLIAEITSAPEHSVLVSSEDFECAVHHTRFCEFIQRLQLAGLNVSILVYLRNQADYVASLYMEMLKHGLGLTFAEFLEKVLATGRYEWQRWIFLFDYENLLARLEALEGTQLIVRSYEVSEVRSPIADYLSLLGLSAADLGVDLAVRFNSRPTVTEAAMFFCANRKNAPLDPTERDVIEVICGPLDDRPLPIARESTLKIAERFRDSNTRVAARYGFDPGKLGDIHTRRHVIGAPSMDHVFSLIFLRNIETQSGHSPRTERRQG
jgi:hypothetical protein